MVRCYRRWAATALIDFFICSCIGWSVLWGGTKVEPTAVPYIYADLCMSLVYEEWSCLRWWCNEILCRERLLHVDTIPCIKVPSIQKCCSIPQDFFLVKSQHLSKGQWNVTIQLFIVRSLICAAALEGIEFFTSEFTFDRLLILCSNHNPIWRTVRSKVPNKISNHVLWIGGSAIRSGRLPYKLSSNSW